MNSEVNETDKHPVLTDTMWSPSSIKEYSLFPAVAVIFELHNSPGAGILSPKLQMKKLRL